MASGHGDRQLDESFQQLFERYHRQISRFFGNRGFSTDESEDLTQETFLEVFKSLHRLNRDANPGRWLFAIATHIWHNRIRSRTTAKRNARELSLDAVLAGEVAAREVQNGELGSQGEGALDQLLAAERRQLLRQALRGLPPQMRRCTVLRLDQGLKYREIADLMQLSIDTVKSQLFQARERLRNDLSSYFSDFDL